MNKATKLAMFKAIGGRAGVSERILKIASEIVECNSYKRTVIGAGQLAALAEVCDADDYWGEKCRYGYAVEKEILNGGRKAAFTPEGGIIEAPIVELKECEEGECV